MTTNPHPAAHSEALAAQMAKFQPRRALGAQPAPAPTPTPAAPTTTDGTALAPAPTAPAATPTPAAAAPAPASTDPASAASTATAPAGTDSTPSASDGADETTSDANAQGPSLLTLLPKEAQSKRTLNAIVREVSRWRAPATLSRSEEKRYREVAVLSRLWNVLDGATRHTLGRAFLDAKERIPHGEFSEYLESACDKTKRTAQRYMLVARVFTDPRVVVMNGFEWCYEVAAAEPPPAVISQIADAQTRDEAKHAFDTWAEDTRVTEAFRGLLVDRSPIEVFGRDLAIDLSHQNVVRDLRIFICDQPNPQGARELLSQYHLLLAEGHDAAEAVRELKSRRAATPDGAPSTTSSDSFEVKSSLAGFLHLRHFESRLQTLQAFEGRALNERAAALAREIEAKLLELTEAIQAEAATT